MRLLIYGLNFHPELTGVGKYTADLAVWLASHGHEVRVVCAPPYYPAWSLYSGFTNRWVKESWEPNGTVIQIRRCPLWVPARPNGWKRVLHLTMFAASSLPVLAAQLRWKPDALIVMAPTLACAPAAISFAKLAGCLSWLHVQDFELEAAFGTGQFRKGVLGRAAGVLERSLLRGFDRVSTISERMLEHLHGKLGRSERTVLIPNWVSSEQLRALADKSPYRKEFGCTDREVLVLYAGSIGEKQGLETLLGAAKKVLLHQPRFRFIICGEGPWKDALATQYANLPHIAWKPLQPSKRLGELLAAADVHVLPQRAGVADMVMPSKLIGMMASGKPVVATAAPDTEIWNVLQGRGLVVPPGDAQALADAIERLGTSPKLGARYGMAARAYVEENFDQDKVLRTFEAQLLELVKKSR